jgi:transcription initiation factor TFIIB
MKTRQKKSVKKVNILSNNNEKCPKCGEQNLIRDYDTGEVVCSRCGLVISDDNIDTGPEWRAFTNAEKDSRPRAGMARSYALYDMGLTTSFKGNRDALGNRLDIETMNQMKKLKRYDTRSKMDDTWGRNLSIAMAELDRMATILHIQQNVKEHAAFIYRKALKEDLIRGRSIDAFVAASIYAACRVLKVPRPLKTVSKASTRQHSEVSRTYRLLLKELKLKMPIDDPMKFIPSIASKLKIRRDTEQTAVELLRKARTKQGLSGKDPRGIAAAALYMACLEKDDKRIQKDVALAAGTTEVTLRNRLRGLEIVLNRPEEMINDTYVTNNVQ